MRGILFASACALALATPAQAATVMQYDAYGWVFQTTYDWQTNDATYEEFFGKATFTISDETTYCGTAASCWANGAQVYYGVDMSPDESQLFKLNFSGISSDPAPLDNSTFLNGLWIASFGLMEIDARFDRLSVSSWTVDYDTTALVSLTLERLWVPEPATWAMMIGGFALVGGTLRRRRYSVAFAQ